MKGQHLTYVLDESERVVHALSEVALVQYAHDQPGFLFVIASDLAELDDLSLDLTNLQEDFSDSTEPRAIYTSYAEGCLGPSVQSSPADLISEIEAARAFLESANGLSISQSLWDLTDSVFARTRGSHDDDDLWATVRDLHLDLATAIGPEQLLGDMGSSDTSIAIRTVFRNNRRYQQILGPAEIEQFLDNVSQHFGIDGEYQLALCEQGAEPDPAAWYHEASVWLRMRIFPNSPQEQELAFFHIDDRAKKVAEVANVADDPAIAAVGNAS